LIRVQVNSRQVSEERINLNYFSLHSTHSFLFSVGRPKYRALPIASASESYVGNQINDNLRGVLKLHYPYQKGVISNWNEMD